MLIEDPILELLTTSDLSASETVDYVAVEEYGLSQSEWAKRRGVSQQAVSKNVVSARKKLSE